MIQRDERQKKAYRQAAIKSFSGLLGPLGTIFSEYYDIRGNVRQAHVNEFVQDLRRVFNFNGLIGIDENPQRQAQIVEVFDSIIEAVAKSSSTDRRKRFRNILCNTLPDQNIDVDEVRRFIIITNELTELQIRILGQYLESDERQRTLITVTAASERKRGPFKDFGSKPLTIPELQYHSNVLRSSEDPDSPKTYALERINFLSEIQYLISSGLLCDISTIDSSLPTSNFQYILTPLGKKLLKYIMFDVEVDPKKD